MSSRLRELPLASRIAAVVILACAAAVAVSCTAAVCVLLWRVIL